MLKRTFGRLKASKLFVRFFRILREADLLSRTLLFHRVFGDGVVLGICEEVGWGRGEGSGRKGEVVKALV